MRMESMWEGRYARDRLNGVPEPSYLTLLSFPSTRSSL